MLGHRPLLALGLAAAALVPTATSAEADGGPVVDPGPSVRLAVAGHTDLPVGAWSWVRVRVRLTGPANELRIAGASSRPDAVRFRPVVRNDLEKSSVVVRLQAKLTVRHPSRIVVRATATGDRAASAVNTSRVRPRG